MSSSQNHTQRAALDAIPQTATAPCLNASDIAAALRGKPQRSIDIGHSRLAYWRFGSGPDLVFVHGWPLHAATFRALVPRLADVFTCHLFDLPGSGRSVSMPHAPLDSVAQARSLRQAIDVLALERYALLAHDSGGLVARLMAAADPRVVSLVLSGTEISGHHAWFIQLLKLTARLPFGAAIVSLIMKSRLLRRSPLGFRACFENLDHLDGDFDALFVAPLAASSVYAARQLQQLRTLDWSVIDRLPETHACITAKVHLIWGSNDSLFPIAKARRMIAEFPSAAGWSEIPASRAFVHEERPQAFVAHARPFLLNSFAMEVQS